MLCDFRGRHPQAHGGIEQPRAVEVHLEPEVCGPRAHLPQIRQRQHRAAAAVVRGLEADEPGRGRVRVSSASDFVFFEASVVQFCSCCSSSSTSIPFLLPVPKGTPHRRPERRQGQDPSPFLFVHNVVRDPSQHARPSCLVLVDVRLPPDDRLLPSARAVREQRRQVAHRARRHPQSVALGRQRGGAALEALDSLVLAPDVVAAVGGEHGLAHLPGREREGVGAELDGRCWRRGRRRGLHDAGGRGGRGQRVGDVQKNGIALSAVSPRPLSVFCSPLIFSEAASRSVRHTEKNSGDRERGGRGKVRSVNESMLSNQSKVAVSIRSPLFFLSSIEGRRRRRRISSSFHSRLL